MLPRRHIAAASALALILPGAAVAAAAGMFSPVTVNVPAQVSVLGHVRIGFSPRRPLPSGGYYYAVLVLDQYRGYSQKEPPPCAVSSEMKMTQYGYAHRGRVRLTLAPAQSAEARWCQGATYAGGIYAVPHRPPCDSHYPCYGKSTQNSACWELEGGHTVCGVAAIPLYSYPGGLPKPLDSRTRIIGHFKVRF
jgi:hypothetical protein